MESASLGRLFLREGKLKGSSQVQEQLMRLQSCYRMSLLLLRMLVAADVRRQERVLLRSKPSRIIKTKSYTSYGSTLAFFPNYDDASNRRASHRLPGKLLSFRFWQAIRPFHYKSALRNATPGSLRLRLLLAEPHTASLEYCRICSTFIFN